ncbi:MAG: tape measure protein [Alphaproteobacteria bacterium]|nr:tape measure protein [Alphaproteobacteria bacterium]
MASQKETLLMKFLVSKKEALQAFSSIDRALVALKDAAKWAQENLSEIGPEAAKASVEVKKALAEQERAFRRLGIRSDLTAREIKESAWEAHKAILASTTASEREVKASWENVRRVIKKTNESIGRYNDATWRKAQAAVQKFGIITEKQAEELKREWTEAFMQMRNSGLYTLTDLQNAHTEYAAQIEALNKRVYGKMETEGQKAARELAEAFEKLGVKQESWAENQRREYIEAYKKIQTSGKASADEIERAYLEMNAGIQRVNAQMRNGTVSAAERMEKEVAAAFQRLGVVQERTGEAAKLALINDFKMIRAAGIATPAEIAIAWKKLKSQIADVNQSMGRDTKKELTEVEKAVKKLGIITEAQATKMKQAWTKEFMKVANSADSTTQDIANAHAVMSKKIEELNERVYGKMETEGQKAAREIAEAFKRLGVVQSKTAQDTKNQLIKDFKLMKASGTATPKQIALAWKNLKAEIKSVNKSIGRDSKKELTEVEKAVKKLGIITEAQATKMKQKWTAEFMEIRNDASKSLQDVANAHAAMAKKIDELNRKVYGDMETDAQRAAREVQEAWKKMGIASDRSAREQRQSMKEAFERIKADSDSTHLDIQRARAALNAFMRRQDEEMGRSFRQELREMLTAAVRFATLASTALRRVTRGSSRFLFGDIQSFNLLGRSASIASSLVKGAGSVISGVVSGITATIGKLLAATRRIAIVTTASWGIFTASAAAAATALARHVGTIAGDFERIDTALKNVVKEDYGRAKGFIRDYAKEVAFSEQELTETFLRLRNFGFNQEDAEMATRAVVEQTAMIGGNADAMEGIATAIGQAYTKHKLMAEEGLQLAERNVAVWDLAGKVMGLSGKELQKAIKDGKFGRKEILLFLKEMQKAAAGSAAAQMETFNGAIIKLDKAWKTLIRTIGEKGLLETMEKVIERLIKYLEDPKTLALIERFAKIGADALDTLVSGLIKLSDVFGDRIADYLGSSMQKMTGFAKDLFNAVDQNWDRITKAVDTVVDGFWEFVKFVGRAVPKAIDIVKDAFTSLRNGLAALDGATKTPKFQRYVELLELLFRRVLKSVGAFIGNLDPDKVVGGLMNIGTSVMTVINAISNLVSGKEGESWAKGLGAVFAWLGEQSKVLSMDIAEVMRNGFGGAKLEMPMMQAIQNFVKNDLPVLQERMVFVKDAVVGVVDALISAAKWFSELGSVSQFFLVSLAALPFVFPYILTIVKLVGAAIAVFKGLGLIVAGVWALMGSSALAAASAIPLAIAAMVAAIAAIIWATWDDIMALLPSIGDFLTGVSDAVAGTVLAGMKKIGDFLTGVSDAVAGTVLAGMQKIGDFLTWVHKSVNKGYDWIGGLFGGGDANITVKDERNGKGFADGGYTGHGARNQPAGTVHKGEFVFSQEAVRHWGIPALESLAEGIAPRSIIPAAGVLSEGPISGPSGRMGIDLKGLLGGESMRLEGNASQVSKLKRELAHRKSAQIGRKPRGANP